MAPLLPRLRHQGRKIPVLRDDAELLDSWTWLPPCLIRLTFALSGAPPQKQAKEHRSSARPLSNARLAARCPNFESRLLRFHFKPGAQMFPYRICSYIVIGNTTVSAMRLNGISKIRSAPILSVRLPKVSFTAITSKTVPLYICGKQDSFAPVVFLSFSISSLA